MEHSENSVSVKGNLVAKPEVRTLPNGTKVASATLGVNNRFTNKAGEKVQEVSFFDVELYGDKVAFLESSDKGDFLQFDGKLRQDRWPNKENKVQSKIKILAFDVSKVERSQENTADVSETEKKKWSNNSVSLKGNLVADPVVKEVSDSKVAEVSVGVNNSYTNKAGEKVQEVSFFDVEAWGDNADKLSEMKKGSFVHFAGKLKQFSWSDAEGKKHSRIKIIPFEVEKLTKKIDKEQKKNKEEDYGFGR